LPRVGRAAEEEKGAPSSPRRKSSAAPFAEKVEHNTLSSSLPDVEERASGAPKKWWEASAQGLINKFKVEEATDSIQKLRRQMTNEEAAFDAEIDEIVIAGKRALLKLRMQRAVEMEGYQKHLVKKIKKQIKNALQIRRAREIARGITREQSRRMKRRRRLELQMKYESAFGRESGMPKSRKWRRRMGRIV